MDDNYVVLFVFLIVFGAPLIYALKVREMRNKETLAMIEKGLHKAPKHRNGKESLRWGIILSAVGVALMLGLYPIGFVINSSYPLNFGPWMLIGLLPTFFGIGLISVYQATKEDEKEKPKE